MNPHSNKNIAQLRHHASSLGITMASRKKKDELLRLIAEHEQARQSGSKLHAETPDAMRAAGTMYGQPVTRAQREALTRRREAVYDPGVNLSDLDKRTRASLPRRDRRHVVTQKRGLDGQILTISRNIPARARRAGVMVPLVKAVSA